MEPRPAESRPALLNLWNARWVLLKNKNLDVHLFIKHLQTNSSQKGDPQEWAKNNPHTSQTGQGMRIRQIVQKVVLLIIDKKKKAFYMK